MAKREYLESIHNETFSVRPFLYTQTIGTISNADRHKYSTVYTLPKPNILDSFIVWWVIMREVRQEDIYPLLTVQRDKSTGRRDRNLISRLFKSRSAGGMT